MGANNGGEISSKLWDCVTVVCGKPVTEWGQCRNVHFSFWVGLSQRNLCLGFIAVRLILLNSGVNSKRSYCGIIWHMAIPTATETMETTEKTNTSLGYEKPPWMFKGSARYQLHLVKSETARAFVPEEFKLVEAFGYTLGGFFLANYEDSPVGRFDELVVIAGIVWNPPTSCAWAARVLVSNHKACMHGRKDVGLPSQVASFTKRVTALPSRKPCRYRGFLSRIGMAKSLDNTKNYMDVQVKEITSHTATDICSIIIDPAESGNNTKKWLGPALKLFLPSFSGRTEHNPNLLKYSCQIECRLRAAPPAQVLAPSASNKCSVTGAMDPEEAKRDLSIFVMLSKPILALEFNCLKMQVDAPIVISE